MIRTRIVQDVLGALVYLFVCLPYIRRVRGRLPRARRLYVCNHVSLLDTLLLGGVFFSRRRVPICVLGDKPTWHKTRFRRLLSRHIGFLIERGAPDKATLGALREFGKRSDRFELIVFPEGTRGDGRTVAACQPGIYFIARTAGVPIVPIFLANVEQVTSKHGPRRIFGGLRKIEMTIGEEFELGDATRQEFLDTVHAKLTALSPAART